MSQELEDPMKWWCWLLVLAGWYCVAAGVAFLFWLENGGLDSVLKNLVRP